MKNATSGYSLLKQGRLGSSEIRNASVEVTIVAELERYSKLVREILIRNGQLLDKVTSDLTEKKYLLYSDIQRIIAEYGIKRTPII